MGLTQSLAEFVAKTRYEDLPERAVRAAKHSFLDTAGITVGGAPDEMSAILARYIQKTGGAPAASLLGRGLRSSARNAALFNGTAGDVLALSDTTEVYSHPSVAILPAVWALAEERGSSGKEVILAYVLGVEVSVKMGRALGAPFNEKGWHPCSIHGAFGATAAAGRILGLDVSQMANALGLAGVEASGVKAGMGSGAKAFSRGRAAENGVVAAELAAMGFTGPTNVLEGADGFLQTFADGASAESLIPSLGSPYEFDSPGLILKPYPCCTDTHTSIDAVLRLRRDHDFTLDDVESVECLTTLGVADYLKFHDPKAPFEAKYSMQYACAVALADGGVTVQSFTEARLADPTIRSLMRRVRMTVPPELAKLGYHPKSDPFQSTVVIRLKDGRELRHRQAKPTWDAETPPSWDALVSKYRACVGLVLGPWQIDESIEIVEGLEDAPDIRRLMDLLRG